MAKSKPPELASLNLHSEIPSSLRYEVDDNAAFSPPSSSHMFQIFDSSEVFSQHPRKYQLLAGQDDIATHCTSSRSTEIAAHLKKRRSQSLAQIDQSSAEFKNLLEKARPRHQMGPQTTKLDVKETPTVTNPVSSELRQKSVAVTERSKMDSLQLGASGFPSADTNIKPTTLSQTDHDAGQLTKLFRAAFGTGSSWQSHHQEFDEEKSQECATGSTKTQDEPIPTVFKIDDDLSDAPEMVPVVVTPEPRRLFGFGPSYQPPLETVLMPADQARVAFTQKGSLVDTVKKAGITAVDSPVRQKKVGIMRPPTGEEMNTWAPSSF